MVSIPVRVFSTHCARIPILTRVKLISEPWDLGPGGYQLGHHPPGFAEWNDRFRDSTRRFWRGDAGERPEFAARLAGSSDLFDRQARHPWASINYAASHDGFTLADVVQLSPTVTTKRTARTTKTARARTIPPTGALKVRRRMTRFWKPARAFSGLCSQPSCSPTARRCCSAATSGDARRAATTMPIARTTRPPGGTGAWSSRTLGSELRSFVAKLIALRQEHTALRSRHFSARPARAGAGHLRHRLVRSERRNDSRGFPGKIRRSACSACAAPPATTTARFRCCRCFSIPPAKIIFFACRSRSAGTSSHRYRAARGRRARRQRQQDRRPFAQRRACLRQAGEAAAMMRTDWRPSFGANLIGQNRTQFRIWAPAQRTMSVAIDGAAPLPMPQATTAGSRLTRIAGLERVIATFCRTAPPFPIPPRAPSTVTCTARASSSIRRSYRWRHPDWRGRPWHEAVLYEAARRRARRLRRGRARTAAPCRPRCHRRRADADRGISRRPQLGLRRRSAVRARVQLRQPDDLRALVDAAHGQGLMMFLDVVYNHFGPDGNYLALYAPEMFRDDVTTPWGPAIDFRRREVRRFFTENALYLAARIPLRRPAPRRRSRHRRSRLARRNGGRGAQDRRAGALQFIWCLKTTTTPPRTSPAISMRNGMTTAITSCTCC